MAHRYRSLAEFFAKTGVQQQAVAKALGITNATISRWTSGTAFPQKPQMLINLSKVTGVSVEALVRSAADMSEAA